MPNLYAMTGPADVPQLPWPRRHGAPRRHVQGCCYYFCYYYYCYYYY